MFKIGDPKKRRKRYARPMEPWQKDRIEEEKKLIKEFGLKNKSELWKVTSMIRRMAGQAKQVIASRTEQAEKEEKQLLTKLKKLGLIKADATIEAVLGITERDVLERRLQTVLFRKGLARSIKQARQAITHHHVVSGGKKVTVPSYLVAVEEEPSVGYSMQSTLNAEDHPERTPLEKKEKPKGKAVKVARKAKT